MNRLEFVKTLHAVERIADWAEEVEEVDEGSFLLVQSILQNLTAFGLMYEFIDHHTICDRCHRSHLESEFEDG